MISKMKQYFYNPLCFNCGSFFVESHLFCDTCFENEIEKRITFKKRQDHFYLFDWKPGESDLISGLVYQLKSDQCIKALEFYACQLAQFLDNDFDLIVPLPGSKKSSVHSQILARQISKYLGVPCLDILKKASHSQAQKEKTAAEREQTAIELKTSFPHEQFTKSNKAKLKVLYVDDILTTGHTYRSSRQALNLNESAWIATVFYRPSHQET